MGYFFLDIIGVCGQGTPQEDCDICDLSDLFISIAQCLTVFFIEIVPMTTGLSLDIPSDWLYNLSFNSPND